MNYKFSHYLNEANYSRVVRMLKGDVPTVDQVAIMTAHNPMGQTATPEQNNKANTRLRADLRQSNFIAAHRRSNKGIMGGGFGGGEIEGKGKFSGNIEDSFLIPHMSREIAIHFARKYKQLSFIWGKKIRDEKGGTTMRFEYIEAKNPNDAENTPYETTQTRDVVVTGAEAQDRSDNYTAINAGDKDKQNSPTLGGNRKFVIPFFDDKYKTAKNANGKRTIQTDEPTVPVNQPLKKVEFYVPFVDDSSNEVEFELSEDVSFNLDELPKRNDVKKLVGDAQEYANRLKLEGMSGRYYWSTRGNLNEILKRLKDIITN
jgi:hypothetical protein